jgi:hypothetical protein
VQQGVVKLGHTSNCVLRIDFNSLPSSVTWTIEEKSAETDATEALLDAGAAPITSTTHFRDELKRIDIYGCS